MLGASGSELLTVAEAANLLRLKPSTMRAWILRRRLPYCKVGRLVRIRRTDVDALIASSVVPARPYGRQEATP
jgi:excisionase family DNA binding protein